MRTNLPAAQKNLKPVSFEMVENQRNLCRLFYVDNATLYFPTF